jgi:polyhydroxybutyrate depolymerase
MRLASAILAGLLVTACSAAAPPLPPARSVVTVPVNGTPRSYILRFPKAYDGKTKLPLVMLLHGATDSAAYAEAAYHFDEKAEKENFALVLPDALGDIHAWSSSGDGQATRDDLAFLTSLLETLPKTYALDPKRVYVTGHSAGAIMTYRLAVERPDLIAAVGIVAGLVGSFPEPKAPVPIVAFHGKLDDTLSYDGMAEAFAFWMKVNRIPTKPTKTEAVTKTVTRFTFTPTDQNGAAMVAYSLANGNHMWPGGNAMPGKTIQPVQDISATDLMWDFFKTHPRP